MIRTINALARIPLALLSIKAFDTFLGAASEHAGPLYDYGARTDVGHEMLMMIASTAAFVLSTRIVMPDRLISYHVVLTGLLSLCAIPVSLLVIVQAALGSLTPLHSLLLLSAPIASAIALLMQRTE